MRQMRTDLMRSAGDELYLQQRILASLNHTIAGHDLHRASRGIIRHADTGNLRILAKMGMHDSLLLGRAALYAAGIKFLEGTLRKRLHSGFKRVVILGKQKQPASLHIKPVAKMHAVSIFSLAFKIREHTSERTIPGKRIVLILALHALRLIDEQHARILKDDLGRGQHLFLRLAADNCLRPEHTNLLPRMHAHIAADAHTVHAYITLLHRLFDGPHRHIRRHLHKKLRKHQAVFFAWDNHLHGYSSRFFALQAHCNAACSLDSIHLGIL